MKTCSETFQFEKDLKWEIILPSGWMSLWRVAN